MNGECHSGLAFSVVVAVIGPGHGGDVDDVEIRSAKHHAGRREHWQSDDAVNDPIGIKAHEPSGINRDTPDVAFLIDGRTVGIPPDLLEVGKSAA
jgi:hypothetical protein